jgi:putative spermidine/putrescine transport system substrate-binding protein
MDMVASPSKSAALTTKAISVVAAVAWMAALACFRSPTSGSTVDASVRSGDTTARGPHAVSIHVVDAAGSLTLVRGAFDRYRDRVPGVVEKFVFTRSFVPELSAKLMAMQAAGGSDVDIVLGGTDILALGVENHLWLSLLPDYADRFPRLLDQYRPQALDMQKLAQGQALVFAYMPAGPLLEFDPESVGAVPTTPEELLAWCRAHRDRFAYARPGNSGPGRTFLMGLPYLLGDSDPRDPVGGWSRTWEYLRDLGSCIEYYPSGTAALMRELGEGSRDMTVTVAGWDINPRALGIVPRNYRVAPFQNMTWVDDAQYMIVPKGVPESRLAAVLDVMKFILEPAQQALTYDQGYFYPGPAIDHVPLSLAPMRSQDVIHEFGRPEYDEWLVNQRHVRPLDAKLLVEAIKRWDREIGAEKKRK